MHHDEFYQVTLREYDLITSARVRAKDQEFRAKRILNQELGTLVQFAFHDPKKMPDFTQQGEVAKPSKDQKQATRSQHLEKMRAAMIAMHYQGRGK